MWGVEKEKREKRGFLRKVTAARDERGKRGGRKQKLSLASSSKRQKGPDPIPGEPRRRPLLGTSERRGRRRRRRTGEKKKRRRRRLPPAENSASLSRFRLLLSRSPPPKPNRPPAPGPAGPLLESTWFLLLRFFFLAPFYFSSSSSEKKKEREMKKKGRRCRLLSSLNSQKAVANHLSLPRRFSFSKLSNMSNPIVFFDITADGAPLGRIEMTVSRWREEERERQRERERERGSMPFFRFDNKTLRWPAISLNGFVLLLVLALTFSPSFQGTNRTNSSVLTSSLRRPRTSAPSAPVRERKKGFLEANNRSLLVFDRVRFLFRLSLLSRSRSAAFLSPQSRLQNFKIHTQARRASARAASPCISRARASTVSSLSACFLSVPSSILIFSIIHPRAPPPPPR